MGRLGVTYHDVAEAAANIQGQNQLPTVDRVRERLRTGSKTTIARYLKEWKSQNGQVSDPDGLPTELVAMVKGLWQRINDDADQKIIGFQESVEQSFAEIEEALLVEQKNNLQLQNNLNDAQVQFKEKTIRIEELNLALEEEKRCTTKLEERLSASNQQLTAQKVETERLHQLLTGAQANLEKYQTIIQDLQEEHQVALEKQKQSQEERIKHIQHLLMTTESQNQQLLRSSDNLTNELKHMQARYDAIEKENTHIHEQLQLKLIQESALKQESERLQHSCAELFKKADMSAINMMELEKKVAAQMEQNTFLQKSLSVAQDKIQVLREEKLKIAQEKSYLEGQLKQLEEIGNHHQTLLVDVVK